MTAARTPEALLARLRPRGVEHVADEAALAAFLAGPAEALLLFTDDPAKVPECWDVAVILPELLRELPTPVRAAVLPPELSRALQARYGLTRTPALAAFRAGGWLGALEGVRDWSDYRAALPALLARPVTRPPLPVASAPAPACA